MQGKRTSKEIERGKVQCMLYTGMKMARHCTLNIHEKLGIPWLARTLTYCSNVVVSAHLLLCVSNFEMGLFAPKEGFKTSLYLLSFKR